MNIFGKMATLVKVARIWERAEKEIKKMDKPMSKSKTVWGVALLALYAILEQYAPGLQSMLGPVFGGIVYPLLQILGIILTGVGLRQAVGTK